MDVYPVPVALQAAEMGQGPAFGWIYRHDLNLSKTSSAQTWKAMYVWNPSKHAKK